MSDKTNNEKSNDSKVTNQEISQNTIQSTNIDEQKEPVHLENITSKCEICNNDGKVTVVTISYTSRPVEVISIFKCDKCKLVERCVVIENKQCSKAIKIIGIADSKNELTRYVYFNKNATAAFFDLDSGESLFETRTEESEVTSLGMMLNNEIESYVEADSIENSKNDEIDETVIAKIKQLKNHKNNPRMRIEIWDPSGNSRIGLPNKHLPTGLFGHNLEFYNDEKFVHEFFDREESKKKIVEEDAKEKIE